MAYGLVLWLIALGLLLPTMHQSSLGSIMRLAHNKLHQLWDTSLLPLLFLVSSIAMGYGVVVPESCTARPGLSTTVHAAAQHAVDALAEQLRHRGVPLQERRQQREPDIWWERPSAAGDRTA